MALIDLGVCIASRVDDVDYVVRAEELGYTHAWFADSQMLWSDPYACLALAATRTSRINLGTGVAVAGTRPAPVTAASIATINVLAPGRTFLGIGTGNTAMRIMGHKPMAIAEFDEYLTELRPLLRGEEADVRFRGRTSPVRHVMPDAGFVNLTDDIPLYVSGFGPKSIALAGKHGDGAVLSIPPVPEAMDRLWQQLGPVDRDRFLTCTLTTICVLEPGEPVDSPRVKAQSGPFAIAGLHYAYDQWRQYGRAPRGPVADVWEEYTALLDEVPAEIRHQRIHAGHNCWVIPEEERFVTKELLEATTLVGTAEQLVERLRALGDAGLDQVMILPSLADRYDVLEQVGTEILPYVR